MAKLITPARPHETTQKTCKCCGNTRPTRFFLETKNTFLYKDGYFDMCNDCIERALEKEDYSWEAIDTLCRTINIPFIPKKWEDLKKKNGDANIFPLYAEIFSKGEYQAMEWREYDEKFRKLQSRGGIENELPLLDAVELRKLKDKWGGDYDEEELRHLEQLYNGLIATQNVSGAINGDQALKLCKLSLLIDQSIRAGGDNVDKLLRSYDTMVKIAGFTPKNSKNLNDFDSIGEIVNWLEHRGWKNPFYDNVTRDIVDETIKNFQNYNRRLYINENGIGDQITERIQNLKSVDDMSNYYGTEMEDVDYDIYDNEIFAAVKDFEEEDPDGAIDLGGIAEV